MEKSKIALGIALASIVGVLVAATIALAQQVTWGQLKCIYADKTKEECGVEPRVTDNGGGDNQNTGTGDGGNKNAG